MERVSTDYEDDPRFKVDFDSEAEPVWDKFYLEHNDKTKIIHSMLDAMLTRKDSYVWRLSLIYAVLDNPEQPVITLRHLNAAFAIADYWERVR